MKQQAEITAALTLWLDAAMTEDEVVTHVRTRLADAFGEEFARSRTIDFEAGRLLRAAPRLLAALDHLLEQTVDMDLRHGIGLSEGEADAREQALVAIAEATGG